jgi:demethylmenaquinone methyltransferase/2-methoxy-6-polyprenyl-1,4-benzoquinol methylase
VSEPLRQERRFFNDIADKWDDMRSLDDEKLRLLINMADINEGEIVLDVGCGTGVLTPFLKEKLGDAGQITAIDFAPNMIERAVLKNKHFTGINYVTGDINDYEPPNSFDKIMCLNFFPHVSDKPAFIQKMKKILHRGGGLIIMHDLSRKAVNSIHATAGTVRHDVLPDADSVSKMLTAAGYSIAKVLENDALYFLKALRL